MVKRIIKIKNHEYEVEETRNITAAEKAAGEYNFNKITCWHNGLMSKLYFKSSSYWDKKGLAGTFFYDLANDLITYVFECPYNPFAVEVIKPIVNVLDDNDKVIAVMRKGNYFERFLISALELKDYINAFSNVFVSVDLNMFSKAKSKVGLNVKKRK